VSDTGSLFCVSNTKVTSDQENNFEILSLVELQLHNEVSIEKNSWNKFLGFTVKLNGFSQLEKSVKTDVLQAIFAITS
jgi:hypothetical protein